MSTTITVPEELKTALEVLDPARMLMLTERLCAPDFAGRRIGTEGHARASAFLIEQFRRDQPFSWGESQSSHLHCSPGSCASACVLFHLFTRDSVLLAADHNSAVRCPSVAASSTERSTASGCDAAQNAATCFEAKKSDCWQKVPRTQSHLPAGRISDKTEVAGVNSWIPSGPTRNVINWSDAAHAD